MYATSMLSKVVSMTAPLDLAATWLRRGRREAVREWHLSKHVRRRGLPRQSLESFFDTGEVEIRLAFGGRYASQTVHEMACLATAAASVQPKKIVEIGTFRGASALVMAANAPKATVYTLDLPSDTESPCLPRNRIDDEVIAERRDTILFEGRPEAARIVPMWGDSATFDFDAVGHDIDLAFIDGSHSYEYVRNDTEKILSRLRPGAVVLWHDYWDACPGVVRYLNEMRPLGLSVIMGTRLVVWRKPGDSRER